MSTVRFIALAGLLLLTGMVLAAPVDVKLSWTPPDAREDGTPLTPEDLAEYRVYYAIDENVGLASQVLSVGPGNEDEVVVLDLQPRGQPYMLNFALTAVDLEGRESSLSNIVTVEATVGSTAAPAPPTALQFEIRCGEGCSIDVNEI